jgi:hypothetical protein
MRSAGGMIMTSSGAFLRDPWGMFVSLDMGNVAVNWTKQETNHYTLAQGLGSGLFFNIKGYHITSVLKGGTWITNYDSRKFLQPQFELFYGQQLIMQKGHLNASLDLMRSRNQVLWSGTLQYRDWSFRHDHLRGVDIWLVMVDLKIL